MKRRAVYNPHSGLISYYFALVLFAVFNGINRLSLRKTVEEIVECLVVLSAVTAHWVNEILKMPRVAVPR